jgi:CheY-like chemotaxis protein
LADKPLSKELHILFVEDQPADAVLVAHELRRAGLGFRLKRVETEEDFLEALILLQPEVILSDHGLPSFDGLTALALAREKCPDVPFIFVTSGLSEKETIEAFGRGAKDCILKSQMSKLAPAVQRALLEGENRLRRLIAEADRERLAAELRRTLLAKRRDFRVLFCPACSAIRDARNRWHSVENYLREQLELDVTRTPCPDCARRLETVTRPAHGGPALEER